MAGIATKENLISLFGTMALDKSAYLFPYLAGSLKDVDPTLTVRNRYPLVFASKMADFDGVISAANRKKVTKFVAVESAKKETHLNLGDDEMREGSSTLNDGMQDMVSESYSYWDEKTMVALEANGVAFDGVAYFHAAHNVNGINAVDGTQASLITGGLCDVVAPAAPTAIEAAKVLDAAIDILFGMKDLNGKLVNQGMKQVVVAVGTSAIATAFKTAIATANGSVSASASASAQVALGLKVNVVIKTGITDGDVYIFRGDATSKAVIYQDTAPETRMTPSDAKDSDNWFTYVSERGIGLGVYYNAVKAVLS